MPRLKNTKAKGSRAERKSKKLLEKEGYVVIKSGGSLGAADLVCLRNGFTLLVQVKAGNAKMSLKEKDALRKQAYKVSAIAVEHRWPNRAKEPIVEEIYYPL